MFGNLHAGDPLPRSLLPTGGRKPINAKAETIATLPMFREAYAQRRCIVPVDGFFEWRAIKGARVHEPSSPRPSL
jgi:putative SOS response-associated peptidase YedK